MTIRAGLLALALCAALTGAPARAAEPPDPSLPAATDVRLGGDDSQTRMVIDLSRKIDVHAFVLANPDRVVIDIPQVVFHFPAEAGRSGRGLVKAFRYGLVMQGGSRLVLDLTNPVRIDKAFVLDAANGQPARLVLDLSAVDRDTFERTIALENRSVAARSTPRLSAPIGGRTDGDPRPLIVIDPGHGGIDTGTQSSGVTEKSIVLDFALLLRDKLEQSGKYRVAMTRTDDTFVPLADRVDFARGRQASLFISIHADAVPRNEGDAQGASIYTLSEKASDADAEKLAESENKADAISGVDLSGETDEVADILIDLAQRETKTFSQRFAHTLGEEMKTATRMHKRPLKSAGFRVLRAPDVPSVLVELGYVSNRGDLKSLTSDSWRGRTAGAIVEAIDEFFATRLAGGAVLRGRN